MIIFGTGQRLLKHNPTDLVCMNCLRDESMYVYFYVHYFHVFWIPVFPYRKSMVTECPHCKQVLRQEEIPRETKASLSEKKPRTPFRYYTGLLLIFVLIIAIALAIRNDEQENRSMLRSPQVGDVYDIKEADDMYSIMRLADIKGDSVGVQLNNYTVDKRSHVYQLRSQRSDDFQEEVDYYHKDFLRTMYKDRYILNVHRK